MLETCISAMILLWYFHSLVVNINHEYWSRTIILVAVFVCLVTPSYLSGHVTLYSSLIQSTTACVMQCEFLYDMYSFISKLLLAPFLGSKLRSSFRKFHLDLISTLFNFDVLWHWHDFAFLFIGLQIIFLTILWQAKI